MMLHPTQFPQTEAASIATCISNGKGCRQHNGMFVTRSVSRATKCSSLLCCYVSVLPITDDSPIYSDEFNFTEKRRRRTRHTLFEKRLSVGGIAYCRHWGAVSCSLGMNTQIIAFFPLWCMDYHRILLLSSFSQSYINPLNPELNPI